MSTDSDPVDTAPEAAEPKPSAPSPTARQKKAKPAKRRSVKQAGSSPPPPDKTDTEAQAGAAVTPAKGARALGAFAVLVALVSLGISGYLWYQSQVTDKLADARLAGNVSTLDSELKGLKEAQSNIEQERTQQRAATDEALQSMRSDLSTLQQHQADLSDSVAKVYAELDRSVSTWAVEEVEQLLLLANLRLRLAADRDTALAALEIADQRLQDLGDPVFVETRGLIAADIATLQTIEPVDIPGVALRLAGAAKVVDRLPLATQPRLEASQLDGGKDAASEDSDWMVAGREVWQSLSALVRVQNTSEPRKPLLAPTQTYFLHENLRLLLHGAQLALLRDATQTYRDDLTQALVWIDEYFDTEDQAVIQFKADLEGMLGANLEPEFPDISSSLAALRSAKQAREAQ